MTTLSPFLSKKELAIKYNVSLGTLKRWLDKIKSKIPFYIEGQRLFAPKQIEVINQLLGYVN